MNNNPFTPEQTELLDHFAQRMRFVHLVTALIQRPRPERIRSTIPDDHQLTNVVLAVLVFIMDRTLRDDARCTMADVEEFLAQLCPRLGLELDEYDSLTRYLLVTVLQNGGRIREYPVIDTEQGGFSAKTLQLITEEQGSYQLTDDVYEFLFRTRELDSEYEFSVTRFKIQESLKRSRYQDALAQSRELINRIRSMKRNMDSFLFRCRENIATVPIDEFERVMHRVHALLEEEEEPLTTIQKLSVKKLEQLREEALSGGKGVQEAQNAVREIIENVAVTIQEQRSLLNRRSGLAQQYQQLVRDQMAFRSFQHFSMEEELLRPYWTMEEGDEALGRFASFLFYPLTRPQLRPLFSLENLYAPQNHSEERAEREGLILKAEESAMEQRQRQRDERHRDIVSTLFACAGSRRRFTLEEYWSSLSPEQQNRLSEGNALLMVMLQLYELGTVSVEQWQETEQTVFEPGGEFELGWCLSQLPEELLQIRAIHVSNSEESCQLPLPGEEKCFRVTNFVFEVDR